MTQASNLPNISHELRNYIGGISGMANLIADNISSYIKSQEAKGIKLDANLKEISECANMLVPYSDKALGYVEDILNSTHMRKGQFTLGALENCDVKELIEELLIFNKSFIDKHKVSIAADFEPNLPKLKCDVSRLKQVLINLITNAAKYSFEGGEIKIFVGYQCNQINIEIADSGIGMNEQEIKMAFAGEGIKIDKSLLNKVPDSHGLGLPIVSQLMELMNGKMTIESTKGEGTRVILSFDDNI